MDSGPAPSGASRNDIFRRPGLLRHCERSEAIQCHKRKLDCFVADAPRNDESALPEARHTNAFASLALTSSAITLSSAVVPLIAERPCSLNSIHPSLKPSSIRIRGKGLRIP